MVTLLFFKNTTQSGISFPASRQAFFERWGGFPLYPRVKILSVQKRRFLLSFCPDFLSHVCRDHV